MRVSLEGTDKASGITKAIMDNGEAVEIAYVEVLMQEWLCPNNGVEVSMSGLCARVKCTRGGSR